MNKEINRHKLNDTYELIVYSALPEVWFLNRNMKNGSSFTVDTLFDRRITLKKDWQKRELEPLENAIEWAHPRVEANSALSDEEFKKTFEKW